MKKISALFIAILMFFNLTLTGCNAADNDEWKNNIGMVNLDKMTVTGEGISVSENTIKITKGGDFEITGTLSDGMIYVDSTEKVKLRLSGANITNTTGPAIYFSNAEKAFVTITEGTDNFLSDSKEYSTEDADATLFSNDDLEIKGSGKLTVKGCYKHAVASDDDLTIENGIISVNSAEHSFKANDTLHITGGELNALSETGKGMKGELEVIIDGGTINIETKENEGIESKGNLTVNGGTINIISGEDGLNTGNPDTTDSASLNKETKNRKNDPFESGKKPEMPEGENPMNENRNFEGRMKHPFENDEIPANGRPEFPAGNGKEGKNRGFGGGMRIDEETAAAHTVTINGGKLYLNVKGDGIDSNGNLIINGGEIMIDGPLNSGNGSLDADGRLEINGGTIITASSFGMMMLPSSQECQNILKIVFADKQTAETEITVKAMNESIITYKPQVDFNLFIFSSPELKDSDEITVLVNGEEYGKLTLNKGITTMGNTGSFGGRDFGSDFGGNRGFGRENMKNPLSQRGEARNERNEIKISLNGSRLPFNTEPIIRNNSTMVEFRTILEALGAEVNWNGETRTATASKDGTTICFTINSGTAYVNGKAEMLTVPPEIINNNTMIPVRFLCEKLNMNVEWNDSEKTVIINE